MLGQGHWRVVWEVREKLSALSKLLQSGRHQAAGGMCYKDASVGRQPGPSNLSNCDVMSPSLNVLGYIHSSLGMRVAGGLLVGYACISSDPPLVPDMAWSSRASILGSAIRSGF